MPKSEGIGGGLAAAFAGEPQSFGFGFITPDDIANELIAEADNEEVGKKNEEAASKSKKRRKKKKSKQVPSEVKENKDASDDGEASNEDELDEAMTLLQQKDKDDQKAKPAAPAAKKATTKAEATKIAIKIDVQPSVKGGATEGVAEEAKKKTRRGKRSKKKKGGQQGKEEKEDSDEDWYDPQPQAPAQPALTETKATTGVGAASDGPIRFVSGARASGRNLVATGPLKVRNSAWAAREPRKEGERDKDDSLASSMDVTAIPSAPAPTASDPASGDSPFSFGFQLTI